MTTSSHRPSGPPVSSGLMLDRDYFLDKYRDDNDPWGFDTSWYEQRKHDLTLASLPERRYRRGVEPGCSNGALTRRLATRCDELIAHDIVTSVVDVARHRLSDLDNTTVVEAEFPVYWPAGTGDLVVWSEVAYYLTDLGGEVALRGLKRFLEPGGHLVSVHFTGTTNYPRTGTGVAPWLDDVGWLARLIDHRDESFHLAVWSRTGPGAGVPERPSPVLPIRE